MHMSCTLFSGSDEVEKCICILQSSCINMHSIEGKDYIASLPFQVNVSVFVLLGNILQLISFRSIVTLLCCNQKRYFY